MLWQWLRRFARHEGGQISLVFAFTSMALILAAGAGIDLGRSYLALQELSHAATLTCQYASRPSVIATATSSVTTYKSNVNAFLGKTITEQRFGYTQTTAAPFTYVANGAGDVSLTASVGTTLMQVFGVSTLPIKTTLHCFDNPSSIPQHLTDVSNSFAVKEGFEANGNNTGYIFFPPTGSAGTTISSPQPTFPSTANYTGANGAQWYIMGYCLETDRNGQIRNVIEGTRSAELDCDNGSGSRGNSSISSKTYLEAGNYELRYDYTLRTYYNEYSYAVICGSTAADISWATSTSVGSGGGSGAKTNQINVYLDANTSGNAPPLHSTLSGQTLAGSNLIDNCLYADNWIERSVRIKVSSPGYYWLTFAADGNDDSYGGQVDDIRLCRISCTDAMTDNFPPLWLTTNNTMFEDTFEAPTYTANVGTVMSNVGNLNNSNGNSSASTSGWPNESLKGWATGPYNQMDMLKTGSAQGSYSIELDGSTNTPLNREITRTLLLAPGYYRLQYRYISDAIFSSVSGVYCGATPTAASLSSLSGSASQTSRIDGTTSSKPKNTNIVGVFMSHTQTVSTPVGGGAQGSQTSYKNPSGTTTTTPTNSPSAVSLTAYDSTQNNPLLDICGYASSWQTRTAYIKILKSNYYQLTFAGLGTSDGIGGAIDDPVLTAMGSLYMASPPANPVTIPVPDPQPDSTTLFTGFSIISDPLTPPAPLQ